MTRKRNELINLDNLERTSISNSNFFKQVILLILSRTINLSIHHTNNRTDIEFKSGFYK